MIKGLFFFVLIFALFFFGINAFRDLTKKEKWSIIKVLSYSALCAFFAFALLVAIVILF